MYMEKLEKEVLGLDPMLDNEKLKTRSYRVTEAMEQKIKDITDELGDGYSQKDAFLNSIWRKRLVLSMIHFLYQKIK